MPPRRACPSRRPGAGSSCSPSTDWRPARGAGHSPVPGSPPSSAGHARPMRRRCGRRDGDDGQRPRLSGGRIAALSRRDEGPVPLVRDGGYRPWLARVGEGHLHRPRQDSARHDHLPRLPARDRRSQRAIDAPHRPRQAAADAKLLAHRDRIRSLATPDEGRQACALRRPARRDRPAGRCGDLAGRAEAPAAARARRLVADRGGGRASPARRAPVAPGARDGPLHARREQGGDRVGRLRRGCAPDDPPGAVVAARAGRPPRAGLAGVRAGRLVGAER